MEEVTQTPRPKSQMNDEVRGDGLEHFGMKVYTQRQYGEPHVIRPPGA